LSSDRSINNNANRSDQSAGDHPVTGDRHLASNQITLNALKEWRDIQEKIQAQKFAQSHGFSDENKLRLKGAPVKGEEAGKELVSANKVRPEGVRELTGIELLSAICVAAVSLTQLRGNQAKARELTKERDNKELRRGAPVDLSEFPDALELWGKAYEDADAKPKKEDPESRWGKSYVPKEAVEAGEPPALPGSDQLASADRRGDAMRRPSSDVLTESEITPEVSHPAEKTPTRKPRNEVVVCALDDNLNFTSFSESLLSSWGYEAAELIGLNIMSLLKTEEASTTLEALREILQHKTGLAFENWVRHKSGKWLAISWSAYWSDSDNKIIGVAHDITAAKELERRRQETVQMVSHDLRSPLTSIQFSLEMLAVGASGDLPEEALLDVRSAQNNTTQLINLVNDLLDLEKIEHGMLRMHSGRALLKDITQASLESMRFLARSRKIELKAAATNLVVFADKERLQQVLVNLIANAIKFSPENSTINIDYRETNGMAEVRVCDQGPGIPDECKEEIFERFKQIEGRQETGPKGTGLGLAICKSIIEGHEGEIGVESQEGKGSTFWFRVPLAGKRETSTPFGSSSTSSSSQNRAAG